MENKVSVIVNFHNGVRHLEKCIKSILEQNYQNLEIILWDNCSDDGSSEIVNKFKDSRIKYFYNKKKKTHYIKQEMMRWKYPKETLLLF